MTTNIGSPQARPVFAVTRLQVYLRAVGCGKQRVVYAWRRQRIEPLYFLHASLHGARTRYLGSSRAETAAAPDCAPHWNSHLDRRRNSQSRRARLPHWMQYAADFFVESAAVGSV